VILITTNKDQENPKIYFPDSEVERILNEFKLGD